MLVLVRSFFYIPYASFSEEMILASFLYTPDASFSEQMNKLTSYMKKNGLELSPEKPCLMLFNIQYNTTLLSLCREICFLRIMGKTRKAYLK